MEDYLFLSSADVDANTTNPGNTQCDATHPIATVHDNAKRVLLYGTGSSSRYFVEQYQHRCQIVLVTDAHISKPEFEAMPTAPLSEALASEFDVIVVASWAISDIAERLISLGAEKNTIYWFQHNKNRVVPFNHEDALSAHRELAPAQILYAFYDLNVARATFDVLGFLCLAERQRRIRGCDAIHVVMVNASNNDFNVAARGIISTQEHIWRKRQILAQSCGLLASCSGFSVTSSREEAEALVKSAAYVFPEDYRVDTPVACWEFDNLFRVTDNEESVAFLTASTQAKAQVQQYLNAVNPQHNGQAKKVVCITLRESDIKPARNSLFDEWTAFIQQLDKNIYFPLILPDTDNSYSKALQKLVQETGCEVYREPCFNVELRMAIYELSYVNLGVNNGPMHLCALSPTCRYLMYKQVTEDYAHTSTQSFIDRGFTIGGDFPGATTVQKLVWEDDTCDVIRSSFEALVQIIQKEMTE